MQNISIDSNTSEMASQVIFLTIYRYLIILYFFFGWL